jgi:branched-chain amino acid transport system ATP-binding protein
MPDAAVGAPALEVRDLHAWYGTAHVLQGVDLVVSGPPVGIVGRNGMGKTTLCQAITGLLGPDDAGHSSGSVRVRGREALGSGPSKVARFGLGYVPQGRRVFGSLTVDEHLRIVPRQSPVWTAARVYETFPRLAERKRHGGKELSGGEQQMLAIGRALLMGAHALIMDEPSEGLAPAISYHLAETIRELASTEGLAVLVVEQNLNIAAAIADTIDVMVAGRIVASMPSAELLADRDAQRRWLGVGQEERTAAS